MEKITTQALLELMPLVQGHIADAADYPSNPLAAKLMLYLGMPK
jgi:hypothetical protein